MRRGHDPVRPGGVALGVLGLLTALMAGAAPAAPVQADPTSTATDRVATTTVDYRGYAVDVPAGWPVIDLEARPNTCVRYDRPAVYLGTPGAQTDCPTSDVGGRTTALLIQPLDARAAARAGQATTRATAGSATPRSDATSVGGTIQVAVEGAGVLITATHGTTDEPAIRDVLSTGELASAARPTTLAEARAAARARGGAAPSAEPSIVTPVDYTGEGFDTCAAPDQGGMDAWQESPFDVVGIYIAGINRGCDQPNLTPEWVSAQADNGWQFIPTYLGLQAPCQDNKPNKFDMDPATAREQGAEGGVEAVDAAGALGLAPGSVIYNDIEAYDRDDACIAAVMSFVSGWNDKVGELGYRSGFYSSGSSGITDLVQAHDDENYTMPDHVWFAWWNDQADVDGGEYVPADRWPDRQRIHQYQGDHDETHGGVTMNIDRDFLDVGPAPGNS